MIDDDYGCIYFLIHPFRLYLNSLQNQYCKVFHFKLIPKSVFAEKGLLPIIAVQLHEQSRTAQSS
jgi:hypothetical protein